eukprot:scaffold437_cov159-Amphora_coffeaeformis.AAC.3
MDVVDRTRRSPRTASPDQSAISGKSDQSIQSTANLSAPYANGNRNENTGAKSPKSINLNNTENGSPTYPRTDSRSRTTSNGKNRTSNYIPPVKSRDHNTRSKSGVRKETKTVSNHLRSPEFG